MPDLAELLEDVERVILGFDGPVCSLYAGESAGDVAERLRKVAAQELAASAGRSDGALGLPKVLRLTDDPLDFLPLLGEAVRDAEVLAASSAAATAGTAGALAAARRSERVVSIVSNNAREAVEAYLTDRGLLKHFEAIEARTGSSAADVARLKPHPHLLLAALEGYAAGHHCTLDEARRVTVFVGGSVTDVQAATAAGVRCIALANAPGKARRFAEPGSGAASATATTATTAATTSTTTTTTTTVIAVITSMHELADGLNARWDDQWCARQYCC